MLPYVPGTPFLGRRENPLIPEDCDRIVFAGIFACDRVETLRRNSGGDLAIGSGNDAIDAKALVVAEQRGNVVAVRGRIEFTLSPAVLSVSMMSAPQGTEFGLRPRSRNCVAQFGSGSRRRSMLMPRGKRPSTAALTNWGARNASESVRLICRSVDCSRLASRAASSY